MNNLKPMGVMNEQFMELGRRMEKEPMKGREKNKRKTLMIKSKLQPCPFLLPFSKNKMMGIYV